MPVQFSLSIKQQIVNVSQSYCSISDDTIFHYFAFAYDLAFIYLMKHNNTTLL